LLGEKKCSTKIRGKVHTRRGVAFFDDKLKKVGLATAEHAWYGNVL
jgi:hypothetical protein